MEEVLSSEDGEALEQVSYKSCECPIPGSVQGQVEMCFEQPGLVQSIPAHCRGVGIRRFLGPFQPKPGSHVAMIIYDTAIIDHVKLIKALLRDFNQALSQNFIIPLASPQVA